MQLNEYFCFFFYHKLSGPVLFALVSSISQRSYLWVQAQMECHYHVVTWHSSFECLGVSVSGLSMELFSPPTPPHPTPLFLSPLLFNQCDGCLECGLMAGLWEFASYRGSIV